MSYLVPESTLFYVHPAGSHTYVQDYECVLIWNHGRKIQNSTSKDKDVFSKDQELFRKDNGLLGKEQELFLVGSNKEVFRQKSVTSVTASLNLLINRNLQVWRIVWQMCDGLLSVTRCLNHVNVYGIISSMSGFQSYTVIGLCCIIHCGIVCSTIRNKWLSAVE